MEAARVAASVPAPSEYLWGLWPCLPFTYWISEPSLKVFAICALNHGQQSDDCLLQARMQGGGALGARAPPSPPTWD